MGGVAIVGVHQQVVARLNSHSNRSILFRDDIEANDIRSFHEGERLATDGNGVEQRRQVVGYDGILEVAAVFVELVAQLKPEGSGA